MSDELDILLSAPLDGVDDDRFSSRVVARIAAGERRQSFLELSGALAALVLLFAVVPTSALVGPVEMLSLNISSSVPVAIACAMLVISGLMARMLEE